MNAECVVQHALGEEVVPDVNTTCEGRLGFGTLDDRGVSNASSCDAFGVGGRGGGGWRRVDFGIIFV